MRTLVLLVLVAVGQSALVRMEPDAGIHARGMPNGWMKISRGSATDKLELVFAVKQSNLKTLERTLLEVSDPDSDAYGRHLTHDAVHKLVRPCPRCWKWAACGGRWPLRPRAWTR